MDSFTYVSPPARVVFGRGTLSTVRDEAARLGCSRVFVVCVPQQAALGERVGSLLGALCARVHGGAAMHTPVSATESALALLKESGADGLLAVGGGSAVGLSKALALRTGLPQLAVPTTYAGSEATSILGQTQDGRKTTSKDERVAVKTIVYDTDLTLSLPRELSVTSAINAMAHAVEALYASDTNPIVELMAADSVSLIRTALPALVSGLGDVEPPSSADEAAASASSSVLSARTSLQRAAWEAGVCLGSVGMGLHHKLCHVLGGALDAPHAQTHAIILPYALLYNFAGLSDRTAAVLARALGAEREGKPEGEGPELAVACARAIWALVQLSGGPTSLRALGVAADDLQRVAAEAAASKPYPNPVPLDEKRILKLLQMAWEGERPEKAL